MRFKVQDESMQPTLNSGDYVLVNRYAKKFSEGDIIVFQRENRFYIKRVEKISSEMFFVTGDNLFESEDSRNLGVIEKSSVVGKVFTKVKK